MALPPGSRLGVYEILSPIGAGGMGEVFKARDTRLDRTVAVKILAENLAGDPQFRERFDREARAISQLTHPNICTLFDIGDQDGTPFIVMELLDGESLASRLRDGPLTVAQALAIAIAIVDALDAAHRAGVVHRDLKPDNVMLTRSGAKLLDFGLAKTSTAVASVGVSMAATAPASITTQGTIVGTFQYMAPEQIEGMEADARTDIFAFGVVLFEMLTGRKAFDGNTRARLIGSILKDEPLPVSQTQPVAPVALDRIVATCLAKAPDDRWQSARDLRRELEWVMSAFAPRATGSSSTAAASRRWTGVLPWACVGGLTVALVAMMVTWSSWRHATSPPPPRQLLSSIGADASLTTELGASTILSPDGTTIAFVARHADETRLYGCVDSISCGRRRSPEQKAPPTHFFRQTDAGLRSLPRANCGRSRRPAALRSRSATRPADAAARGPMTRRSCSRRRLAATSR